MDNFSSGSTAAPNGDNQGSEQSPGLDTALLETIFYNEMMMMDGSSSLSPDFVACLSSGDAPPSCSPLAATAPVDASTIAERALLRDFGVSSPRTEPVTGAPAPTVRSRASATTATMPPAHQPVTATVPPQASSLLSQPPSATVPMTALPATAAPPTPAAVSQERAKQLVSQFATLASRLGISLPSDVLSSLTAAAAVNEAQKAASTDTPVLSNAPHPPLAPPEIPSNSSAAAASFPNETQLSQPATSSAWRPASTEPTPAVQQLQHTAEAAIAAVSETRKRTQSEVEASASASASAKVPPPKPMYSKRRKKPRLSDCESKLATLRAENEMLKRHLDTVTNQSRKFEEERKQAEDDMRRMIKEGAGPDQLDPVLHKFSEMYSDYGRHRNQELTFHLQQLEKLAAPTNFTKMGLWSLGQSEGFYTNPKQNPIAGILRKELGITPAQGRKILDQRQKIRDLSANIKECFMLLGKLKALCEHKQKVFHDRMSKCQEILKPLQVAKLLLWVDEHTHLLESVCPGWGSERIRSAANDKPARKKE